jgi:hypothetical protein
VRRAAHPASLNAQSLTDRPPPPAYRILIGEIDEEDDKQLDLASIRAEPLPPIRY